VTHDLTASRANSDMEKYTQSIRNHCWLCDWISRKSIHKFQWQQNLRRKEICLDIS